MNHFTLSEEYNDIVHLYVQRSLLKNSQNKSTGLQKNYFYRIISIIKLILSNTINALKIQKPDYNNLQNKIWLIVLTQNNINALNFLKENYNSKCHFLALLTKLNSKLTNSHQYNITEVYRYPFIHNLKWIYYYFLFIIDSKNINKSFFVKYPHIFFIAYVSRITSRNLINHGKPELIIFANDINIQNRALNIEARKQNIHTVYIQHATISSLFPPLNFDLALLEGQYSADVYKKNSNTNVILIGQPKFEKYKSQRRIIEKVKVIGIAFNTIDNLKTIQHLIKQLNKLHYKVVLRPHPRERRIEFLDWLGVSYFSSNNENSFDFLHKIDFLIAADSSIHLESILLNIPSTYYNMNQNIFDDYYGYVSNGLIKASQNINEINQRIHETNKADNTEIYKHAKYYCESTYCEFNSIENALNAIDDLLRKN
jgi:hypothetical protein